jgi:hypothetical protein
MSYSYKKYVEIIDLNDITSEPTERSTFFLTLSPTSLPTSSPTEIPKVSPSFVPTHSPINQPNNNPNNTDFILIGIFSSISGLAFILLILWCKYKHLKKNDNYDHFSTRRISIGQLQDEEFGTQYILDDV